MPRVLRKRATQNIYMAVEPDEGGELAHGRLQPALPERANLPRRAWELSRLMEPQGRSATDAERQLAHYTAWKDSLTKT
jgi:hypothetical protein